MADLKQVVSEWDEFLNILKGNTKWVLEIGTFRGQSAIGLSKVADNVITIDFHRRKFKKPKNCTFLVVDSTHSSTVDEIKKMLNGDMLDALFIDGAHTYKGVKSDFEMYSPLVKDGGVIGLHDIVDSPRHRRKGCDVHIYWGEIKDNYKHKEIVHDGGWAGIGVLWK